MTLAQQITNTLNTRERFTRARLRAMAEEHTTTPSLSKIAELANIPLEVASDYQRIFDQEWKEKCLKRSVER